MSEERGALKGPIESNKIGRPRMLQYRQFFEKVCQEILVLNTEIQTLVERQLHEPFEEEGLSAANGSDIGFGPPWLMTSVDAG